MAAIPKNIIYKVTPIKILKSTYLQCIVYKNDQGNELDSLDLVSGHGCKVKY